MTTDSLTHSPSYRRLAAVITGLISLAYVAFNIFYTGNADLIIGLNNYIVLPLALICVVICFITWKQMPATSLYGLLWAGLGFGFAFWALAEFWWAGAELISDEIPYPSWADLFWIIGYLPMYVVLGVRIRSLPGQTNLWREIFIWSLIVGVVGATTFGVLFPILNGATPGEWVENTLNVLFPILDLVLLVPILRMTFAAEQGRFESFWKAMSAGFILHSISNLLFSVASLNETYYPDGQLNLMSTLGIDVTYVLGYVFWATSLIFLFANQQKARLLDVNTRELVPVNNQHILFNISKYGTIIEASLDASSIFKEKLTPGIMLSKYCGIPEDLVVQFTYQVMKQDMVANFPVQVQTLAGPRPAVLVGLPVREVNGDYLGCSAVLILQGQYNELALKPSLYHSGAISYILKITGVKDGEDADMHRLIREYYIAHIKSLYNQVLRAGGSITADGMEVELKLCARKNGLPMSFPADQLLDASQVPLENLLEGMNQLLETAKAYTATILGTEKTEEVLEEFRQSIPEAVHQNLAYYQEVKQHPSAWLAEQVSNAV